jgi:hypothetical protein
VQGPPSVQLIANGDFAVGLSPWTTSRYNQQGDQFTWNDGKA